MIAPMTDERSSWDRWQRLAADSAADPLEVLRASATFIRYFFAAQARAVSAARAQGRTWEEIADAVGRTRQAAWQRWRHDVATKDPDEMRDRLRHVVKRSVRFLAPPPPVW